MSLGFPECLSLRHSSPSWQVFWKEQPQQWKVSEGFATFFPEAVGTCESVSTSVHLHKYVTAEVGVLTSQSGSGAQDVKGQGNRRNPRNKTTLKAGSLRELTSLLCGVAARRGNPQQPAVPPQTQCPASGLCRQRGGKPGKWPPNGAPVDSHRAGYQDRGLQAVLLRQSTEAHLRSLTGSSRHLGSVNETEGHLMGQPYSNLHGAWSIGTEMYLLCPSQAQPHLRGLDIAQTSVARVT